LLSGWDGKESYESFLAVVPGAREADPALDIVPKLPATLSVGVVFPKPCVRAPVGWTVAAASSLTPCTGCHRPADEAGERRAAEPMVEGSAETGIRTDADVFVEVQHDAGAPVPGDGWGTMQDVEDLDLDVDGGTVHGGRMNAPNSPVLRRCSLCHRRCRRR
jgi:hypothetical protein